jgi:ubiquinone/menaquinone biosynthesis C-methylase UbiE
LSGVDHASLARLRIGPTIDDAMTGVEIAAENVEATEAWNGPLFDVWRDFQAIVVGNARAHGDAALADHRPEPGDRVLDIGCGLGDSTLQLAELVGPEGHAHGVDVAERMIAGAREDAERSGIANVTFEVADVQATEFAGPPFDYAFARFGTMFFANPVAALRNVRSALRPGGRLNIVVWRRKLDNDWLHRAEVILEDFLERPDEYEEPTCGPGPFSMANADTVSDVLKHAGFQDVALKRQDLKIKVGDDLEHAVELVMSIGPAGEVLRLWGDRVEEVRPKVRAALLEGMADMVEADGVYADSSTWAVRATAPA